MFLVLDTATNNVLGEYQDLAAAEASRIQIVGGSPSLAKYVEVVDLDRALEARERAVRIAASREQQPA